VTFTTFAGAAVPYLAAAFVAAAVLSFVLTPLVRRIALRVDAVDEPNVRRVNVVPIPRGGGVAVAIAFIVVAGGFVVANGALRFLSIPFDLVGDISRIVALLLGGALAAAFGVLDDYFDLRARWQFAGQLGLAALAIALGVVVVVINSPIGPGTIPLDDTFGVAFTVLWIVGMINSINFIDGLDGLSSGVALIAALTLGTISLTSQVAQPFIAVLCFALAGALLGFLRWNFQPASVFIGTSGVMFVGYTLAVLSILGTAKVAVARPRRADHRCLLDHRPAARPAAVPLLARPRSSPPSPPRCRTVAPADGAAHLRGLRRAWIAVAVPLGGEPAPRVLRHLRAHRPRPVPVGKGQRRGQRTRCG
jgi:UDP-N-acetylmuramyl pentapeptide phosphotransferase/UDP-N-acetylglucosamine-1-phosphate transferase